MRKFARSFSRIFPLITFLFLSASIAPLPAFGSEANLRSATAGNIADDDLSGEDLEIRRVALEALGTAAGTVVVMNAQNGQILTIVNQDWAIRNAFKPCSTIKIVTGIAGYSEELIRRDGSLANGSYRLGLDQALAYSNNAYFQKVGAELGNEKMIFYAGRLGLGTVTGINAPGESAGRLPFGNSNLRIYSHADDFEVTPLQLAVMVSAVTNGGRMIVPRIPKTERERANFRGYLRRILDIEPSVYKRVIPGMLGAAEYGTAKSIPNDLRVAGKTGSCISKGTWVGLFASAAPVEDPKFAVVVITRGKYARGRHSAAVASKIYQALRPRFERRFDRRLIAANPRNSVDRRADVDERSERSPSVTKTASARPTGTVPAKRESKAAKPKSVEEMFPTIVIEPGKTEITRPRVIDRQ
ncbi:MAG TPA: penicillin-binding transpeptidase domain-containing protein [Aridibacter sp.]|nr:penicillin-binding transpeptidase domain-containing protein [Aridibacter sp.]